MKNALAVAGLIFSQIIIQTTSMVIVAHYLPL